CVVAKVLAGVLVRFVNAKDISVKIQQIALPGHTWQGVLFLDHGAASGKNFLGGGVEILNAHGQHRCIGRRGRCSAGWGSAVVALHDGSIYARGIFRTSDNAVVGALGVLGIILIGPAECGGIELAGLWDVGNFDFKMNWTRHSGLTSAVETKF